MSQNPLPSLFGRFTAIFRDHDRLAQTLRRLRQMCVALDSGQASLSAELAPDVLVLDLRDDLREHFGAEETEEYFGTVVDEAPSLAAPIAALKWEHLALLRTAEALCGLARERGHWHELPAPTRRLIAELEAHERAESKLLRSLFSGA